MGVTVHTLSLQSWLRPGVLKTAGTSSGKREASPLLVVVGDDLMIEGSDDRT